MLMLQNTYRADQRASCACVFTAVQLPVVVTHRETSTEFRISALADTTAVDTHVTQYDGSLGPTIAGYFQTKYKPLK
jgi:hypothetical protein